MRYLAQARIKTRINEHFQTGQWTPISVSQGIFGKFSIARVHGYYDEEVRDTKTKIGDLEDLFNAVELKDVRIAG